MEKKNRKQMIKDILSHVSDYYSGKIKTFGPTSKGVDWKDEKSQITRFEQLIKVIENPTETFSLNDIGCGYGKLYEFLSGRFNSFVYYGYDISTEMIEEAKKLYPDVSHLFFTIHDVDEIREADYSVASGIFNVKLCFEEKIWIEYVLDTLKVMNLKSRKGFAFNILTKYSDEEYKKDYLFYADPLFFFDFCVRNFSRHVVLFHDYGLFEFTIVVRKRKK